MLCVVYNFHCNYLLYIYLYCKLFYNYSILSIIIYTSFYNWIITILSNLYLDFISIYFVTIFLYISIYLYRFMFYNNIIYYISFFYIPNNIYVSCIITIISNIYIHTQTKKGLTPSLLKLICFYDW